MLYTINYIKITIVLGTITETNDLILNLEEKAQNSSA